MCGGLCRVRVGASGGEGARARVVSARRPITGRPRCPMTLTCTRQQSASNHSRDVARLTDLPSDRFLAAESRANAQLRRP